MAINIFEGARRITKLGAVVWAVSVSSITLLQGDPYITGTYYISTSEKRLGPSHPSCRYLAHFRQEDITVKTRKGTEARVSLCFPPDMKEFAVTIPPGDKFAVTAPVVATEQEVMAYVQSQVAKLDHRSQSEETTSKRPPPPRGFRHFEPWREDPIILDWDGQTFAEHVENTLVLSQADEEWIQGQWWAKRWEQVGEGVLVLVAGMVFLWVLTWSIGWIVRGFLGIPRGKDQKAL